MAVNEARQGIVGRDRSRTRSGSAPFVDARGAAGAVIAGAALPLNEAATAAWWSSDTPIR